MTIAPAQLRNALLYVLAFVVAVTVHEFGHAWVATRLGDGTPRADGRLTLWPGAHIDRLGTLILPLVGALMPGVPLIAWGKPVRTNMANYSTRVFSRRTGHMLVALAGPMMNLVLALVVSIVFVALAKAGWLSLKVGDGLIKFGLRLNVVLMVFNLIPVPPLDGGAVLAGILPASMRDVTVFLQRYGAFVLFGLVLIPGAMDFLLTPAYRLLRAWVDVLAGFAIP